MTTLMDQALRRLTSLPDTKQNVFAGFILAELDSEDKWDALFSESQDMLAEMARQAVAEEKHGETKLLSLRHDFEAN
ncbi:MAG: hypothetical protein ABL974_14405 [Prosthecobacter sp.]